MRHWVPGEGIVWLLTSEASRHEVVLAAAFELGILSVAVLVQLFK